MALAEPTGGAGRGTLIDALNRLKQQYGGGPVIERGVAGGTERPVAPGPPGAYHPGAILAGVGAPPPGYPGAPPQGAPGGIAPDGYGAIGWGANGINLYNPNLARGDVAAPGPGWVMDNYGTPFWRHDYVAGPGGRPIIKGSDGYAGDLPLLTPQQLAQWGIT